MVKRVIAMLAAICKGITPVQIDGMNAEVVPSSSIVALSADSGTFGEDVEHRTACNPSDNVV